ncbi:GntR family transcriptional regulator [Acidisoma cellulosilytica]|uniref:GntR family transcriptional regulator n=1 Tax=Acidisoma cellulosilyticum TaxID=2802395 RepID=A0A963Z2H6_9PROT|nr:GntR family transcriptional regulator [Acidisoma cellulosilyticum]MCB8881306.1 GntR family transcriptional regulator [Acidisoma cellulosilyticum]
MFKRIEAAALLKLSHETLTDRAYAALKKALTAGDFAPGHVLVIRTVAEAYGISPTPVREALQRLVAERMLVLQSNRSIIVPYLSDSRFAELTRIRCALEGMAAERAATRMTPAQLDELRQIVAKIEDAIARQDIHAYVHLNRAFHFGIYECAESPILLSMIEDLWCQVGPFFTHLFDDIVYVPKANNLHFIILELLAKKDAEGVRDSVRIDIDTAALTLTPQLESESAVEALIGA